MEKDDGRRRRSDPFEELRGHRMEHIAMNGKHHYSVLMPLVRGRNGAWEFLFEVRAGNIRQGGEICFPGGEIEGTEWPGVTATREAAGRRTAGETSREAAVRETSEELLIDRNRIDVICPMLQVTGPGGADVDSWLGVLREYEGTFSKEETASVFTLPLSWFRNHAPEFYTASMKMEMPEDFPYDRIPGGRDYPFYRVPKEYCFYDTPYGVLWGLTAQLVYYGIALLPEGL